MDDVVDVGQWLVDHRAGLDRGEAAWLECLARFDRDGLWALDGFFCCASWLVWQTKMKRSTAFEKLRVAHELARRPIVAEAFAHGRISYSAVRAITRMDRPDPAVDEAMVALAANPASSIRDLELAVRAYLLHADQDKPPGDDRKPVRDVKIRRGDDGMGQVTITLTDVEIEELVAALQAFIDLRYRPKPVDESSPADTPDRPGAGDVRFYPQPADREPPTEQASRPAQKANAFMDLVNSATATADGGHAAGDDRYLVHIVKHADTDTFTLLDRTPIHPSHAAAITCDSSTVTHTTTHTGEPLHLGRKTREWNTAQRRAIAVRDGGHCRFPGCDFTHYDIHHMQPWEHGGPTDIDNAFAQCRRHHRLLHAGYHTEGDPNGELAFYRPDGTYLASTHPATTTKSLAGV